MNIDDLFTKYGTDKGIWGYGPAYMQHLHDVRMKVVNVLEIGICGYRDIPNNVVGASLFAWRDFFPHAEINGFDNDGRFIFNDQPRIHTVLCDAYDPHALANAVQSAFLLSQDHRFDFICDDAVHDPLPQMALVRGLWPHLCKHGVYAIEDVCPYKVANGDLYENMIKPMMIEHPDMIASEYSTHKAERLIVLTKQ
jgi:hypothetical protein